MLADCWHCKGWLPRHAWTAGVRHVDLIVGPRSRAYRRLPEVVAHYLNAENRTRRPRLPASRL